MQNATLVKQNIKDYSAPEYLFDDLIDFEQPFFNDQIITYIGNKRALLQFINEGIVTVKNRLSKKSLIIFDGFSGSGVVSRLLKYHAKELHVNDLEDYCEILNKCYLSNKSEVDFDFIKSNIDWLNKNKLISHKKAPCFIQSNYAPANDNNIKKGERVFYTNRNAKIIDNLKYLINKHIDRQKRHFFLAPLIVKASINTNTSGVFKGFHKKDGIGWFGGRGENALTRIKREIHLDVPVFSEKECKVIITKEDVNKLVKSNKIPKEYDLAYFDPPYNQHPYGSNYFMLNIIANEKKAIEIQDGVSGIAKDWNRSAYNKKQQAEVAFEELIQNTRAKYILISYNNEGIIDQCKLKMILEKYGKVDVIEKEYNTYRGSRNLNNRNIKVREMLWILEKNK